MNFCHSGRSAGAVGRRGAAVGELPGPGRPGAVFRHSWVVRRLPTDRSLGSHQTKKCGPQGSLQSPVALSAPEGVREDTIEVQLPPGTRATTVCRIITLAESGCPWCPPTSLLQESESPGATLAGAGALPLHGPYACVRQDFSWRRAWPRGRGLEGPVPRTEVRNQDWGPNTVAALASPPGLIVHTSLPSRPPLKFVWGRGGRQEAGSPPLPCIQFSPSLCLESCWEKALPPSTQPEPSSCQF